MSFSPLDLSGDDVILPKSVSWAEHNEERIIENREMMANLQKFKHKIGKIHSFIHSIKYLKEIKKRYKK